LPQLPGSFKGLRRNWTITPKVFPVHDLQDIFERKRFEIEPVGSIVVVETVSGLQLTMMV